MKVYFSVHYGACVCYQLFNAKLKLFRETLPVAPAVRFVITATHFGISPRERYMCSRLCVKWSTRGG